MLTNAVAMASTRAMALAMTWRVTKWAMARVTRAIITSAIATVALTSPPLSQQLSSSLLPSPQLPNAIALSTAIAAPVAIARLFDTAIKWQWYW
jgi:hypothetical protein